MTIQIDNAVIDYSTITDIVQKLSTHSDQFASFTNGALVNTYDSVSAVTQNLPVSATLISTVRHKSQFASGSANETISFGATFGDTPNVTVTVQADEKSQPIAFITKVTKEGIVVSVKDLSNNKSTATFILHIIAIGRKTI